MKTSSLIQLLKEHKILIPVIQRDYAQGRETGKIPMIRSRFLGEIFRKLSEIGNEPMELDFIYGNTFEQENELNEKMSYFTPLDGQQRLTTLFLIHWYVAAKEGFLSECKNLLIKFSYATRPGSSLFCEKLVNFQQSDWDIPLDKIVVNQPWFFASWKNDPTISSMLVMLREIQIKYKESNIKNVWSLLTSENPKIVFHLLPMEKLGLPDDLYIKMNSRGKELTDYEYFKSQFSEILEEESAKIFNEKIDRQWSDLFWNIFKNKSAKDLAILVDSGFLSFFWYITDILVTKNKIVINRQDWLSSIKKVYFGCKANIEFLFNCLDLFEKLNKEQPEFFETIFYINKDDFTQGKIRMFFLNPQINLFHKCAETYGYEGKSNSFSIGEQLILYACIIHLLENTPEFPKRIRTFRNMLSSSEFQLRKEYLESLYEDTETIIRDYNVKDSTRLSKAQWKEEIDKWNFISIFPNLRSDLYKLEDHLLLRGTVSIINLDNNLFEFAKTFDKIFSAGCNYMEISLAMLTVGNYSQGYGNLRRLGNKNDATWRELFTPNEYRKNFDKTKIVLTNYLQSFISDQEQTNQLMIDDYYKAYSSDIGKPKDWVYYYMHYSNFRYWNDYQTDGFYYWHDYKNKPYECWMLFRSQFNGRHWSPFLLVISNLNKNCILENFGNELQFTVGDIILLISNINNGFKFKTVDEPSRLFLEYLIANKRISDHGVLEVDQEKGFDLQDRIITCCNYLRILEDEIKIFQDNNETHNMILQNLNNND